MDRTNYKTSRGLHGSTKASILKTENGLRVLRNKNTGNALGVAAQVRHRAEPPTLILLLFVIMEGHPRLFRVQEGTLSNTRFGNAGYSDKIDAYVPPKGELTEQYRSFYTL